MRRAERRDNGSARGLSLWRATSGQAAVQPRRKPGAASLRGAAAGRPLTGMTEEVTVSGGGRSGDASPAFERWRDCFRVCAAGVTAPQARPRPPARAAVRPRPSPPLLSPPPARAAWPGLATPPSSGGRGPGTPAISERTGEKNWAGLYCLLAIFRIEGLRIQGLPQ